MSPNEPRYFVYIMTNKHHTVLYTGVTSNLPKRVYEHKNKVIQNSFTAKYNIQKLIYFELFKDILAAIEREKQIKAGSRSKKIALIESVNPDWKEMSAR